ncbi:IPT/TIG domain/outer membrane autotransporter barrel domain-containing protein, partial [Plesiomonas shigelloides]
MDRLSQKILSRLWLSIQLISGVLLLLLSLAFSASAGAVTISPASGTTLAEISLGQPISIQFSATGGTPPYQYFQCDVDAPDYDGDRVCLPPGLSIDMLTGLMSGIITTPGNYIFQVSAVENWGGISAGTYRIVVTDSSSPTITNISPTSGSSTGGTSVTLTGTNFTGATGVSFGGTAATGYTVDSQTQITATTPAHSAGSVSVSVTTPSGNATQANGFTYIQAPVAGSVTKTVTANSSNNAITLNLSGGTATSVAVAANASHGTATASGTSITYTPTAGYSGSDSFTYTATNAAGTSTAATVSITVTAPTLSLTPSTLSAGTVAAAYSATISAGSGTAPYSYAVTLGSLPDGLILNTSTGELSGTPTADGTSNFTITATDANSATGARAYSLVIGVQPVTANAVTTTVAANSSANTITLNLTGGTATSVAVATNASHGTATASGTSITYTPTAGYSGADS